MVESVNDTDGLPIIEHVYLGPPNVTKDTLGADPFAKSAEEIRDFAGLSPSFKRGMSYQMKKVRQNFEGTARTKQIEVDEISGYNLFGAVMPPYNLDYLAKLYEKSAPHYAASNAKVSNIVGLGYKFVETSATKRA